MAWTDDRVATLKKRWLEGRSATEIAKELRGVTRNAVIGKVTRLGLAARSGEQRQAPKAPSETRGFGIPATPRRTAPLAIAGNRMVFEKPEGRPPHPRAVRPQDPPGSATVLTLGAHMCKPPIGDPAQPGFTFCGRRQGDRPPYCREHALAAYQPVQQSAKTAKNLSAPSVGRGRQFNTVSR